MAAVTLGVATPSTSNAATYASGSFTPAVGDLLVVFVVASGTVLASPTMSNTGAGGALGWTLVASAQKAAGADRIYMFVANALVTSAVSSTVTFNCTGDNATGAIVTVLRVSGMTRTGTSAVRQSAKQDNQGAGTPAPAYASSALTGNAHVGVVGNATNPATMTAPASWTERADSGYNTPATGSEVASRDSGFTGTTVTWGSSSASAFGSLIAELDTSREPVLGDGTSDGTSTASASAFLTLGASTSSAGTSTSTASATLTVGGIGSTDGTSTASASGALVRAGEGSAAGAATADATGTLAHGGAASTAGAATATSTGTLVAAGAGATAGTASVDAVAGLIITAAGVSQSSADPYLSSVELLLRLDGPHGATSTVDESPSPKTLTFNGDAILSTAQQAFGTASLYCNGGGSDGVTTPDIAAFDFTGDFTIEAWVRFEGFIPGAGVYPTIVGQRYGANADHAFTWEYNTDTDTLEFVYTSDGTLATLVRVNGSWSPTVDVWYHVAVSRTGSEIRQFVDGVQVGSTHTMGSNIHGSSEALAIGNVLENGVLSTSIVALTGFLDDVRITIGVGRYSAGFTPAQIPTGQQIATAVGSIVYSAEASSSGASTSSAVGTLTLGAAASTDATSTADGSAFLALAASATTAGVGALDGDASVTGPSGTTHDGEGTAAGTSSATAAGGIVHSAAGTGAGAASATAAGSVVLAGAASSAGVSSATGAASVALGGAGAAAGTSTASSFGPLSQEQRAWSPAGGGVVGFGVVGGSVYVDEAAVDGAGSTAGSGSASASATLRHGGVGASAGAGTAAGVGTLFVGGTGATAGTGAASAAGALQAAGSGASVGGSTLSASGGVVRAGAGSTSGAGWTSGAAWMRFGASASTSGLATVDGEGLTFKAPRTVPATATVVAAGARAVVEGGIVGASVASSGAGASVASGAARLSVGDGRAIVTVE